MNTKWLSAVVGVLWIAGCGGRTAAPPGPEPGAGAPAGHDHAAEAGHDHEKDHDHEHAERRALGTVRPGGRRIDVFQVAPVAPGAEADFDLDFEAGVPLPAAVRGWIGVESGRNSRKVRFAKESASGMHGHPEVPDPLPDGCAFWIEVEDGGATHRVSIPFAR